MPVSPHCTREHHACVPSLYEHPILATNITLHCFTYLPVPEEKGFLSFLFEFLETTAGCCHSDDAINSLMCWMTEWMTERMREWRIESGDICPDGPWATCEWWVGQGKVSSKENSFLLFGPRFYKDIPQQCTVLTRKWNLNLGALRPGSNRPALLSKEVNTFSQ